MSTYGDILIFNADNYYFVSKNPIALKDFTDQFNMLWEGCEIKTNEEVIGFLKDQIRSIRKA